MDEFIYWPKPYILLSTTFDEILSWRIEYWMKNHLVSDNNYNTVDLWFPKKITTLTNNVGLTFSVGGIIQQFTISIDQDN